MKRYSFLIIILSTILILGLAFHLKARYLDNNMAWKAKEIELITDKTIVKLHTPPKTGKVYRLDLKLHNKSSYPLQVRIANTDTIGSQNISLGIKKLLEKIEMDWYEEEVLLIITREKQERGNLSIDYRFLTLSSE